MTVSASSPAALLQRVRAQPLANLTEALALWRGHDATWQSHPELYRSLGARIIGIGEPLLAYDIVREGLAHNPSDVRLRELQALALARSGAPAGAIELLQPLLGRHPSSECLGILARAYKDLADREPPDSSGYKRYLRRAADTYYAAFRQTHSYWTGINAATTALLIGRKRIASGLAKSVLSHCRRRLRNAKEERYWLLATIAEAYLVQGKLPPAVEWYSRAAQEGQGRLGDLASTRRNARLILRYLNATERAIDAAFAPPQVVVFAGHMIDSADRATPRFPARLEAEVARRIDEQLQSLRARIGYSSAACGADILFVEAMLKRSAEVTIVLPTEPAVFRRESVVRTGVARSWGKRFDAVLQRVSRVVIASSAATEANDTVLSYTNELLFGMALLRAGQFDSRPVGLAVWDGNSGDGVGGTASAVRGWHRRDIAVSVINPTSFGRVAAPRRVAHRVVRRKAVDESGQMKIRALLFGDALGFSKLTEPQVVAFTREVLGRIADVANRSKGVVSRNTWGDGVFFVLRHAADATTLALELAELVTATQWSDWQLPPGLSMRLALHAGPVWEFVDPVVRRRSFSGTHISRAARIEPITPPGQVYASEAFACLAVAEGVADVAFDYAGQTPLAKGYGTFPTYHVRRLDA